MKKETRVQRRVDIVITLQEMLSEANKRGDTDLELILKKQIERAKRGDLDSAKFILDRVFGTPTQYVRSQSENDTRITIQINEVKP